MKIRKTAKPVKTMSKPAVTGKPTEVHDVEGIIANLNAQFAEIGKNHVIGRTVELEAILLALLTGRHVMLEGPPGTAKSLLVETALRVFADGETFFKQLMPGTLPEEVFGPINPKKFREEGRIEFETEGYLPNAHFCFLDEVYRGPDAVLNSLLMMLNERKFKNGNQLMHCPLITCIGTTNFISRTDILHAFRDRWYVTVPVNPADGSPALQRIGRAFLSRKKFVPTEQVTLAELYAVQKAVRKVEVSDEILALYADLVSTFRKGGLGKGQEVTDRRFAEGLHAVQAGLLMHPDNIDAVMVMARYALLQTNETAVTANFDKAYNSVVGDFKRTYEEAPRIAALQSSFKCVRDLFSEKKPKAQLRELRNQLAEVARGVQQASFTVQTNSNKQVRLQTEIRELDLELATLLGEVPAVANDDADADVDKLFSTMLEEAQVKT